MPADPLFPAAPVAPAVPPVLVQVTVVEALSPQSPSLTASVRVTEPPAVQVKVAFWALALLSVPAVAVQW